MQSIEIMIYRLSYLIFSLKYQGRKKIFESINTL